jgi:S1-C subfamily serine protease
VSQKSKSLQRVSFQIWRIGVFFFALTVGLFWSSTQSRAEPQKTSAVVEVLCPTGASTGFFIEPNLIATTAHSVENCKKVVITLEDGKTISGRVLAVDSDRDVALLVTPFTSSSWFKFASETFDSGDLLILAATPERITKTGVLSPAPSTETNARIFFEAQIVEGNSGSPILSANTSDLLMGMVLARGEGLGVGLAADEIQFFIDEVFYQSSTGVSWPEGSKQTDSQSGSEVGTFLLAFLLGILSSTLIGLLHRRYRQFRRKQGRIRIEIQVPEEEKSLGN